MNYRIILAVVIATILVTILLGYLKSGSEFDIDESRFEELFKQTSAIVIDVRTESEFKEGKIDGAILIDISRPDFKEKLNKLDKKKTYLVYCRSGSRSRKACSIMSEIGFDKCYNLKDGIIGWKKNNRPVQN